MAERRMFAKSIVDSDAFLDMPLSTQCLYFHLNERADDDGFVGNAQRIVKLIGANTDDLTLLIAKKFLLSFETGVVVVKHWLIHNYIRKDRYNETNYKDEKNLLYLNENNSYTFKDTGKKVSGLPMVDQRLTQVRLGKVRKGKVSIDDDIIPIYDASKNPELDKDRLDQILKERNTK